MHIPASHPRHDSLVARERIVMGMEKGLVAKQGLIAHGRGEAFDYLLGERTCPAAKKAAVCAGACLFLAERPVISVNGNTAVLAADKIVQLTKKLPAMIEVNVFHRAEGRVEKLVKFMEDAGAQNVLGTEPDERIPGLEHARGLCCGQGIHGADVVLVPLEDGDRAKALVDMGKKVLTIDLNPLSRTSRTATVTIVDELSRALENITLSLKDMEREIAAMIINDFDNNKNLKESLAAMDLNRIRPNL